jgi:hypothetical protein
MAGAFLFLFPDQGIPLRRNFPFTHLAEDLDIRSQVCVQEARILFLLILGE